MKTKKKNPTSLDQAFQVVCEEMLDTFLKKHHDYGKGNILLNGELVLRCEWQKKLRESNTSF